MVKNAALGGNNPHPTVGKRIWREKIQKIWDQGITEPGTRLSLTKALAWHMVFIERLPAAEVSTKLVEWVYRTGKTTSKDVQNDLALGSRKVERKTREYVNWLETRRQKNSFQPGKLFAKQELDHVLQLVKTLPSDLQPIRARFLLDFLNFAKKCGRKSEKGYECNPSVDGVIKKWENCRNAANYKLHLDWAVKVGLIVLVKEKSQRAHRARTYAVVVPFVGYEEWSLGFQKALDYLQEALLRGENSSIEMRRRASSDGYREIVSLESSEDHNLPRVRWGERVAALSNSLILDDSISLGPSGTAEVQVEKVGIEEYGNNSDSAVIKANSSLKSCQGEFPAGFKEYQYQGSAPTNLARGPSTCPGKGQAVQGLDHRPVGSMPTLSKETAHQPASSLDMPFRACPAGAAGSVAQSQIECRRVRPVPPGIRHRSPGREALFWDNESGHAPALASDGPSLILLGFRPDS